MAEPGRKKSQLRAFLEMIRRLLRKKPPPSPSDPFAYAMVPVKRGPRGRSGAAVAELDDDSFASFPPRK